MRCKHGVVGGCLACSHEEWQRRNAVQTHEVIAEMGRLLVELGDRNGLDTSRLEAQLDMLAEAGLK